MAEGRRERLTGWRRIAAAIWRPPSADPVLVGDFDLDCTAALDYLARVRAATGARVSITHLVGKAVAHGLAVHPDLNRVLVGDRFEARQSVDLAFIVAFAGGAQQAGVTIEGVERMPIADLSRRLDEEAAALEGRDAGGAARVAAVTDRMPLWMVRGILRLLVWLSVDRGVDLSRFGIPAYGLRPGGFGSALISSVGMLGIDRAFPGITPFARVPLAILIGRIGDRPAVVGGEVAVRPVATISAAIDHRSYDGSHAGRLLSAVRAYLDDPDAFDPLP